MWTPQYHYHVCVAYAPTDSSLSDGAKESFYKDLVAAYRALKMGCKAVLVLGDFNYRHDRDAKRIAPLVVGQALDSVETTDHGLCVLDFCKVNGLRICNTWFNLKRIRSNTWCHPVTKRGVMLDLVLGPPDRNVCLFRGVRVCRSAEGADSDH